MSHPDQFAVQLGFEPAALQPEDDITGNVQRTFNRVPTMSYRNLEEALTESWSKKSDTESLCNLMLKDRSKIDGCRPQCNAAWLTVLALWGTSWLAVKPHQHHQERAGPQLLSSGVKLPLLDWRLAALPFSRLTAMTIRYRCLPDRIPTGADIYPQRIPSSGAIRPFYSVRVGYQGRPLFACVLSTTLGGFAKVSFDLHYQR